MSEAMQSVPRPPSGEELVYDDGEPMESARHVQQMVLLIRSLELAWSHRKAPDVVIELLSESTESVDRGEKMRVYAQQLRVGEYFLFDPFSGVLEGYELDAPRAAYRPKEPDSAGRFFSERTGLLLGKARGTIGGVEAHWLRWIDPSGRVLPEGEELATLARAEASRADAEASRADAEASRADAEAARARELEAEVRRLKGEPT
jgi:hypothetical protein